MEKNQTPLDAILMNIVLGRFKAGDRLIERDLVAQLGVSRTPIRQAIQKLESLGLVRCFPKRGAVVTEFSPTDIEALYFMRLHQERLAAKLAFHNLGPDDIASLQAINRDLQTCLKKDRNLFEMIEIDRKFHHTIYQASGNRFLTQMIDELRLKCYVIAYYAWRDIERVKRSVEDHREMVRALKRKDMLRFQSMIEQQLVSAKAFYLDKM